MGLDTKANLIVGISMAKLFTKIDDISNVFDEHDKFGNKTGKQFKEEKLIATLPNGEEICIANSKNDQFWNYSFYDSLGFDGEDYEGDNNITMSIHRSDYEVRDLTQMIMGLMVCETEYMGGDGVKRVDEIITNEAINRVRKELNDISGYTGDVELYLINYLSY